MSREFDDSFAHTRPEPEHDGYERDPRPERVPGKRTLVEGLGTSGASRLSALPRRREMERAFGADFGDVEAFVDPAATAAIQAQAFTDGRRVVFSTAEPSPELVAHELTHVVQQRRAGAAAVAAKSDVSSANDAAEREADAVAAAVASGGPLPVIGATPAAVARKEDAAVETDWPEIGFDINLPSVSIGGNLAKVAGKVKFKRERSSAIKVGDRVSIVEAKIVLERKAGKIRTSLSNALGKVNLADFDGEDLALDAPGLPPLRFKVDLAGPSLSGDKASLAKLTGSVDTPVPVRLGEFAESDADIPAELRSNIKVEISVAIEITLDSVTAKALEKVREALIDAEERGKRLATKIDEARAIDEEIARTEKQNAERLRERERLQRQKRTNASKRRIKQINDELKEERTKLKAARGRRKALVGEIVDEQKGLDKARDRLTDARKPLKTRLAQKIADAMEREAVKRLGRFFAAAMPYVNVLLLLLDLIELIKKIVIVIKHGFGFLGSGGDPTKGPVQKPGKKGPHETGKPEGPHGGTGDEEEGEPRTTQPGNEVEARGTGPSAPVEGTEATGAAETAGDQVELDPRTEQILATLEESDEDDPDALAAIDAVVRHLAPTKEELAELLRRLAKRKDASLGELAFTITSELARIRAGEKDTKPKTKGRDSTGPEGRSKVKPAKKKGKGLTATAKTAPKAPRVILGADLVAPLLRPVGKTLALDATGVQDLLDASLTADEPIGGETRHWRPTDLQMEVLSTLKDPPAQWVVAITVILTAYDAIGTDEPREHTEKEVFVFTVERDEVAKRDVVAPAMVFSWMPLKDLFVLDEAGRAVFKPGGASQDMDLGPFSLRVVRGIDQATGSGPRLRRIEITAMVVDLEVEDFTAVDPYTGDTLILIEGGEITFQVDLPVSAEIR